MQYLHEKSRFSVRLSLFVMGCLTFWAALTIGSVPLNPSAATLLAQEEAGAELLYLLLGKLSQDDRRDEAELTAEIASLVRLLADI